jgi:cleavage stimulation factor subunit 3
VGNGNESGKLQVLCKIAFETFFNGSTGLTGMSDQQDIQNENETPTDIVPQDVYSSNGDKTQPTEEILNALNALNPKTTSQNGHGIDLIQQEASQDSQQDPPSEWHVLREKLREHPQDPDGWNKLVDIVENTGDLEQIKQSYEALLETYPNTV